MLFLFVVFVENGLIKMVLEAIVQEKEFLKHPIYAFVESIILVSASIFLSALVFPEHASILTIAFISIGLIPMIRSVLISTEEDECKKPGSSFTFLERHSDVIKVFGWFFIGLIITFSAWYVILPQTVDADSFIPSRQMVFGEQEKTIGAITQFKQSVIQQQAIEPVRPTGKAIGATTNCGKDFFCWFNVIFMNNATLLGLAILLSLAYSVGAIFLVVWNASILATIIGTDALSLTQSLGAVGGYATSLYNALGFLPHGIPEFLAYFIGAIAGAILSLAITSQKYREHGFETIAKDTLILIILAYVLLLIGALIEAATIVMV